MNESLETWQVEVQGQIYETDFEGLVSWIGEGSLLPGDKVRRGNLRWLEAGKIPALYGFFNAKELGTVNPPVVTTTSGEPSSLPAAAGPAAAPATAAGQNHFDQPPPPPQFSAAPAFPAQFPQQANYQTSNYSPAAAAAAAAAAPQQPVYTEVPDLVKSAANWYFWIAGLSLVNTIILLSGGQWAFITGLAITQMVDGIFDLIAMESGSSAAAPIGFLINLVITGVFVIFGVLGRRGAGWAFLVGMILYALDGALYLLVGSFLGVVVHGIALFYLWRGWQACD